MFNGLSINPAYAGSRGTIAGTLLIRNQWAGFEGAPKTESLSFHMPGNKRKIGIGFNLINDKIGYLQQQWMTASYAFIVPTGQKSSWAFGLRGGLLNFRINWNEVKATDLQDPILNSQARALIMPNFGSGLYFKHERFFAGLSMPHLLNSRLRTDDPMKTEISRLYRHVYFNTGFILGLNNAVQWKPSVLLKYSPGAPVQVDVNLMALLSKRFWIGSSWRSNDAIAFMFDFQFAKQLRLGYAFDYSITELQKYNNGTHEFMLGFEIVSKQSKMKSPRYF
jgi:type IX secretion system PorP/SprF family membrane protein